jgi:hypothetical protein
MSTTESTISKSFNLPVEGLVRIKGGFYWSVSLRKTVGVRMVQRKALTSAAEETVQTAPVATHKWAARVGMYNNDPIWAEIFKNVRDSRKRRRVRTKSPE